MHHRRCAAFAAHLGAAACPADDPEPSLTTAATSQDDEDGPSDPTGAPVPGLPIRCDGITESGARYCDAIRPPTCDSPPPGTGDTSSCDVGVCPCEDDADCIDDWGCTPAW